MLKSIASLWAILALIQVSEVGWAANLAGASSQAEVTHLDTGLIDKFKVLDGKYVYAIKFLGLQRTREQAIRWLMKTTEGSFFSSRQLAIDIQSIYNTSDLYDITPEVHTTEHDQNQVDIVVTLKDKWTLLPVFGAQGGGGALTYGGGLYDSNLGGYFINMLAFAYNYNGVFSYDLNFNEEYVAGTQLLAAFDWSHNVNPTIIHNINGSAAGQFTWERQQEEIMIGTHLKGPIRVMAYAATFFDALRENMGVNAAVFEGNQYRIHPKVIFGRVNLVNYLEEGDEFTLHPSFSNIWGPVQAYQSVDASYKNVIVVGSSSNVGFRVFGGAMSLAPAPYEYQVGGYQNLRGFVDSRQIGRYTAGGNFEFRPLLFQHRFHVFNEDYFDIDLVAVQGCLFTDVGSAWGDSTLTGDDGAKQINLLWSAGAGIRMNFLHFAGAIVRIDVAHTIRPDEGWGLSFGVGQFF